MPTEHFEMRNPGESPQQATTHDLQDSLSIAAGSNGAIVQDTTVPDGGYGWVAVFGCDVLTWWFVGTTYSWGVIQAAVVKEGLSEASTRSFVGSLTTVCVAFLAIMNARIVLGM
jgi:hypothetical protein